MLVCVLCRASGYSHIPATSEAKRTTHPLEEKKAANVMWLYNKPLHSQEQALDGSNAPCHNRAIHNQRLALKGLLWGNKAALILHFISYWLQDASRHKEVFFVHRIFTQCPVVCVYVLKTIKLTCRTVH
uniref:Uncharacterized protein n=1 Tax=Anguilla anguilla TaxID=7936 RepID=A0A0E9XWI5_ANGAN